ncbi:MAG: WYL domain-containing protein, partial [Campylobacterales bacterium]
VLRNTESHVPREIQEFLDWQDLTIFSKFGVPTEKVIVEVDREVASYFIAKKFHPTQRILDTDLNNGGMLLEFKITNPREITFLTKKWLPHIQILRPVSIRQEFEKIVRQYLSKLDNI